MEIRTPYAVSAATGFVLVRCGWSQMRDKTNGFMAKQRAVRQLAHLLRF